MSEEILNVTPEEFYLMHHLVERGELDRRDYLASYCIGTLGCKPFGAYKVVVRRDVPSIPWFSKNVARIEVAKGEEEK